MKWTKISKESFDIFQTIIKKVKENEEGALKLDADEGFMPLHTEHLYNTLVKEHRTEVYSLAHYFEQNGDLVPDPDMEIMYVPEKNVVLPMSFQNQISYTVAAYYDEERGGYVVIQNKYKDLAEFLDIWLKNINEQQNLQVNGK